MQDLELDRLEAEGIGQLLPEPGQGFDALGKEDQPVAWVRGLPTEWLTLEMPDQPLELAEAGRVDLAQGRRESLKRADFRLLIGAHGRFPFQQFDPAFRGIQRGKRAGEHGLLHAHPLQLLLLAVAMLALLGKRDGQQRLIGGLFLRAGRLLELLGDALLKVGADLIADVFLEAAHHQPLVAEILWRIIVGIADRRRIEQTHERGEASRRPVVRRGRQKHHRVGPPRQQPCQPRPTRHPVLMTAGRHVVALVDDDDVPPGVLQVVPVLQIGLEGIDRDDGPIVKVKGVVVAGDGVADPLQSNRIQPHERNREPAPEFLLELSQHALLRDHQNALPAPTLNQLGGENAGLQRFAQADRVGDQDALPRLPERLQSGIELIGHQIHHPAVAEMNLFVVGCAAAQLRLQIEKRAVEVGASIRHQFGLRRIQNDDLFLQHGEEL